MTYYKSDKFHHKSVNTFRDLGGGGTLCATPQAQKLSKSPYEIGLMTMREKQSLARAVGIQKEKLGATAHFSELKFGKKNVMHCFVY